MTTVTAMDTTSLTRDGMSEALHKHYFFGVLRDIGIFLRKLKGGSHDTTQPGAWRELGFFRFEKLCVYTTMSSTSKAFCIKMAFGDILP